MKKFALLLTAAFSMTLILDSCSVQKRYHRKGFTVNWNNASVNMKKNRKVVHTETIQEEVIVSNATKEKLIRNYETPISMDVASAVPSVYAPSLIDETSQNTEKFQIRSEKSKTFKPVKELNNKEVKSTKKAAQKIIKAVKKNQQKNSKTDTIIYILLILLVPFGTTISMYLYEGSWTSRVTANLLLTLLCGLPGLIHALVVILGNK
ncbi:MAG: YqaE/Pmp3 family membrane protein [Crocinitomicaceae bacterium]|nr:YqaE/Pmp3 family membrane protein [Crocinitomicaceae bacterium]MDG1735048.1 YqaE/Pmp3 family membrane protein [Crocinitomicaceae bacterium]